MFAYEAFNKGWLPSASGQDILASNAEFSFLRDEDVTFYDTEELESARNALEAGEPDDWEEPYADYNQQL